MFKVLGPFTRRLTGQEDERLLTAGVSFLYTAQDICWYSFAAKYPEPTLYKVVVAENGKVRAMSNDITMLFPEDCVVVVTDKVPAGMLTSDPSMWRLVGDTFTPDDTANIEQATRRKNEALQLASAKVDTLRDIAASGDSTPGEQELFESWRSFRIAVNRLDVNLGTAMVVPPMPE